MFLRIRSRITYANVAATLALLFAMSGGAYAAGKYLITSTKQIKPSVLKSLQGKAGAKGPSGASGPAGPAGPAGTAGAGTPGTQGGTGPQGPAGVKGESGTTGAPGKEGKEGSPWTAGGTLPSGKTETGTWTAAMPPLTGAISFQVPISFSIPLTKDGKTAFYFAANQVESEEFGVDSETHADCRVEAGEPKCVDTGCHWNLTGNSAPEAKLAGALCVFEQFGEMASEIELTEVRTSFLVPGNPGERGYGPAGAYLQIEKKATGAPEAVTAAGAYAVTAP